MLRIPVCLILLTVLATTVFSQELDFTPINMPGGSSEREYVQSLGDDFLLLSPANAISVDKGRNWYYVDLQIPRTDGERRGLLRQKNGDLLIRTRFPGVLRSTDNGSSWSLVVEERYIEHMTQLANGDILYSRPSFLPGLYQSDTLFVVNASFDPQVPYHNLPQHAERLLIRDMYTTQNDITFIATNVNVYRSLDTGRTWQTALNIEHNGRYDYISTITEFNSKLKIVSRDAWEPNYIRINTSTDDGLTWTSDTVTSRNLGNDFTYKETGTRAYLIGDEAYLYAPLGTNNWTVVEERILTVVNNGDLLKQDSLGIKRSTDNGSTWFASDAGIKDYPVTAIAADRNDIIAWRNVYTSFYHTKPIAIFSSDLGATWSYDTFLGVPMGDLIDMGITRIEFIDSLCYIGTTSNGLYKLNRNSSMLSQVPATAGWEVKELQINRVTHLPVVLTYDDMYIFYSGDSLYRSYPAPMGSYTNPTSCLAISNDGTIYRLFHRNDWDHVIYEYGLLGLSEKLHFTITRDRRYIGLVVRNPQEWVLINESPGTILLCVDSGRTLGVYGGIPFLDRRNILFTGGYSSLTYNIDFDHHWYDSGYKGRVRSAYVSQDNTIFIGTQHDGILMTNTSINASHAPPNATSLTLSQNYPNPVTGSTTIPFSLNTASDVSLEVYNTLGRKVATVLHSRAASGAHSMPFDASALVPGMYRYVLRTPEGVQSKWMTVVR